MPRYETYSKVKEIYNVSPETVRAWAKRGQIQYKCIQNATRKTWLFDIDSIGEFLQANTDDIKEQEIKRGKHAIRIIYVRVSSIEQSADLQRQRDLLLSAYPDTEVMSDIGSGLDFSKSGIAYLVRKICRDQVSQVIITFKDRLCRFGYELFEIICKEHGCSILVHGNGINDIHATIDPEFELKDDLMSIVNVFASSHNGRKSAILKKERKRIAEEIQDKGNQDKGNQDKSERDNKSQTLSNTSTEEEIRQII